MDKNLQSQIMKSGVSGCFLKWKHRISAQPYFEVSSLSGVRAVSNCSWKCFDDWAVFGFEGSTYTQREEVKEEWHASRQTPDFAIQSNQPASTGEARLLYTVQ